MTQFDSRQFGAILVGEIKTPYTVHTKYCKIINTSTINIEYLILSIILCLKKFIVYPSSSSETLQG